METDLFVIRWAWISTNCSKINKCAVWMSDMCMRHSSACILCFTFYFMQISKIYVPTSEGLTTQKNLQNFAKSLSRPLRDLNKQITLNTSKKPTPLQRLQKVFEIFKIYLSCGLLYKSRFYWYRVENYLFP